MPAKHIGWMSRHGERLELPAHGSGEAGWPVTQEKYVLPDGVLRGNS